LPFAFGFSGILLAAGLTYRALPPDGIAADANAGFTFVFLTMIFGPLGFLVGGFLSMILTCKCFNRPAACAVEATSMRDKL